MSDGYDCSRHGGDFPTLRDDEVELLNEALTTYHDLQVDVVGVFPRGLRDAYTTLFLKARHAAAQRKIGPYGG